MTIRDQAYTAKPIEPFVIDAHTHLASYYMAGWHQKKGFADLDQYLRIYDTLGIDCCVTAPHMIIESMTVKANEAAAEAARQYPGRIYGYISVAPYEGLAVLKSNLCRFGANPAFVGLKFLGGYNGEYTDPIYRYATDFAQEARCPILCHTWANNPSLPVMRDMAECHPDMNLICAHLGGGSKEMTLKAAKIVREVPNFHLEICGSLWNHLGIEDVVNLVGANRVIFGTDVVNLDARFDFGRVAFAPMDDTDKRLIFAENYLRLLEKSQMGKIRR